MTETLNSSLICSLNAAVRFCYFAVFGFGCSVDTSYFGLLNLKPRHDIQNNIWNQQQKRVVASLCRNRYRSYLGKPFSCHSPRLVINTKPKGMIRGTRAAIEGWRRRSMSRHSDSVLGHNTHAASYYPDCGWSSPVALGCRLICVWRFSRCCWAKPSQPTIGWRQFRYSTLYTVRGW